jgi:hypothetical protein
MSARIASVITLRVWLDSSRAVHVRASARPSSAAAQGKPTANARGAGVGRGSSGNDINLFVWIENVLHTLRVNVVASTQRQGEIRAHVSDTLHGMEITGTHYEPRLIKNRLSDAAQNAACGDSCA